MKTILEDTSSYLEVKHSKFYCYFYPLESPSITSYLDELRKMHPKADHFCYAYLFDDYKHFSDDGEPGGTAGMPIFHVLEKEGLNHVLVVVVRYFGGIKLGAGGLVRAYTKAVTSTLPSLNTCSMEKGYQISLTIPYEEEKNFLYLLGTSTILHREYDSTIHYTVLVSSSVYQKLMKYQPIFLQECMIKELNSSV